MGKGLLLLIAIVLIPSLAAISCSYTSVQDSAGNLLEQKAPASSPAASPASSSSPASASMPAGLEKIQHFVFIMQENRSFDHYFGTYPGANGIPQGVAEKDPKDGKMVTPFHDTSDINRGGPHDWDNAQGAINNGKMDGYLNESYKAENPNGVFANPLVAAGKDPKDVMGYHDYHEIPNYWNYARLYVLQDAMFESVASYSLPAHLYMLAAQSGGYYSMTGQAMPSTYNFPEITELLTSGKVDWKYYVTAGTEPDTEDAHVVGSPSQEQQEPGKYSYWNPLPAFSHIQNNPSERNRLQGTAQF